MPVLSAARQYLLGLLLAGQPASRPDCPGDEGNEDCRKARDVLATLGQTDKLLPGQGDGFSDLVVALDRAPDVAEVDLSMGLELRQQNKEGGVEWIMCRRSVARIDG